MEWNNMFTIILLVFGVVLTNYCGLSYLNDTMDASKLCSMKNNTLKLGGRYNEHGIVLSETGGFSYWFDNKVSSCVFEVKAHRRNKIIAVIQTLSFRQDEWGNCTDYVQFKSGMEESEKLCGLIRALHTESPPDDLTIPASNIARNAFVVHDEGKLNVTIYVANKELKPDEELDLEIVFTSARDCPSEPHVYTACGSNLCIRREFLKDGFVNCPSVNCPDEDGCYHTLPVRRRAGVGNRVTIGAVTAVLMSFVLFFGCVWITRRSHSLCWSAEFSRARISRLVHFPPAICEHANNACCEVERCQIGMQTFPNPICGMQTFPNPICPAAAVSGDGLAVVPAIAPEDKDLPPPYESLFPGS